MRQSAPRRPLRTRRKLQPGSQRGRFRPTLTWRRPLSALKCCPRPSRGRDAPPSVVGPRTWQVMSWRRRAKLEFPQTNCRNRVAWATWKSEPWIFPSTASTSWSS
ncbi:hypothetical protein AB1E18_012085 [Capra hircus]